jgi:hypothetical protein
MKVCTITTSNDVVPNASNPLTLIGVEKTPTPCVKKPKTAKTFFQKSAKKFRSVRDDSSISFNDFDVDGCVIGMTYGACQGPSYLLAGVPGVSTALAQPAGDSTEESRSRAMKTKAHQRLDRQKWPGPDKIDRGKGRK